MLCKHGREYLTLSWIYNSLSNNIQKLKRFKLLFLRYTILILSLFLFNFVNFKEKSNKTWKSTNKFNNNFIINRTNYLILDKYIEIGLNELGINNVNVQIKVLTNDIRDKIDDENVLAFVKEYEGSNYIIWINDDIDDSELIKIISHELIHIKQYNSDRLVIKDKNIYWENVIYNNIKFSNYYNRPWENEAYKMQFNLTKIIKEEIKK